MIPKNYNRIQHNKAYTIFKYNPAPKEDIEAKIANDKRIMQFIEYCEKHGLKKYEVFESAVLKYVIDFRIWRKKKSKQRELVALALVSTQKSDIENKVIDLLNDEFLTKLEAKKIMSKHANLKDIAYIIGGCGNGNSVYFYEDFVKFCKESGLKASHLLKSSVSSYITE